VSPFDPEAFARASVEPMARHTFPFLTSIVGIESESEGALVGSAVRCMLGGRPHLVTAQHVVDQAMAYPRGAGFVARRGEAPTPLGAPVFSDSKTDLAVVATTMSEGTAFWPEDRIDPDADARERDYLFVHGFPGERSRFVFGELHSLSLPYGVMQRDDDLPADKRPEEFAVDFDPLWFRSLEGGDASFVKPAGLSGSPVWRVGTSDPWSPERSLLVGIVTRYNHDKRVLLIVGIASLLALMRES
jgi:hypothetical protein